ncbi:hypothetical protein PQ462_13570 [Flavobacterium sp. KACC 22758]|uniref:hypothetical protein n=1 Tax=Flavobacterium sp. KACC 22758 TaxID=3025667 RepID=UPI002366C522|nr:hypothetical protein [Flavobacterium sp. KACC 22758]WDF57747.1 hypothetical protein PQ462_13570 [Flavobacterium sp. KACC 22758]
MVKKTITSMILCSIIGCSSYKEKKDQRKKNHKAYVSYLVSRNIDTIKANDLDYYDDFFEFKEQNKRHDLIANPFLKTNKVYVYQGGSVKNTFCIFSDDGNEYLARIYKADSLVLTKPENGIVKLKRAVKLEFLGNFELTDTVIKISRNIRELSGKEYNECDIGILQKDTLRLIENYDTKLYSYKKKWLAKRYKTNYKLVYQPNLKATRIEATKTRNPSYLVEGSFALEEN